MLREELFSDALVHQISVPFPLMLQEKFKFCATASHPVPWVQIYTRLRWNAIIVQVM